MPTLPPRRGLFRFPAKKDAGAAHCISVRRIMFSYAWLKPLPKTSVVLSMDMKAFRCSLWMNSCSWSASWRVRVV